MSVLSKRHVLSVGTLLIVLAVALTVGQAQVKKGKSRPLRTGQLMKGVMKPNCDGLKKGLEAAPANDEAWESLGLNAALINEASFVLMDDGRCPDGVWADAATKTLRQGSADLLKAVEMKDYAAAKSSFGNMTKACSACHEKHKEKK